MHFVRDHIPSKKHSIKKLPTESFMVELNLRKKKRLLSCFYNPNNEIIESHFDSIFKSSDIHSNIYEYVILLEIHDLISLLKATCFKNPKNPSYIDLVLTSKPPKFY